MTEGRRYKILGAVGRGGFGTVYRAELTGEGGFSKIVALKVLNPDMEEVGEMAIRLRDEARVLGLLRHRAIVQVDGLVRLSGRWTVVMEYVEGADLKQVIAAAGTIPPAVALTVLEEVAGALHVAYTRNGPEGNPLHLLHRDIKPSNIQVTAAGETKLLDFGVARAEFAGREAETRSLMFGSVGYMSPERLDFVDGPEGDVYALGAVLYEMLGGVAFGKTSSKEQRHEARLLAGLDALLAAGIAVPVVEFVAEMMAYEPGTRPAVRDIERRAARLRGDAGGPTLRDWAEDHVSPVLRDREDLPDELSGCTLVEQGSTAEAAASVVFEESIKVPREARVTPPPARQTGDTGSRTGSTVRTAGTVAAVGGVGLIVLFGVAVVVAGLAWFALGRGQELTATSVAPPLSDPRHVAEASPDTNGKPAAPSTVAASQEPPTPAPSVPRPTAGPPAARRTEPPTPAPKTTPAAPRAEAGPTTPVPTEPTPTASAAHVSATGNARTVELVANGKRFPMGDVPAGAYTIEAMFGDSAPIVAGELRLVPNSTVTLRCDSVFTRCQVR
ncbi:MAG: serine/threonine-protein kinase [Pseudomonadota bacterium]|nr:serine/threonine-protein kinase [Pseudomonadota bacterium]